MELGYLISVLFHLGVAEGTELLTYQECWELADQVHMEREFIAEPEPGSYYVGVSCTQTQTIIAAPAPKLRG